MTEMYQGKPSTYRPQSMAELDAVIHRMAESYRRQSAADSYSLTAGSYIPTVPGLNDDWRGRRQRRWMDQGRAEQVRDTAQAKRNRLREQQLDREYRAQRLADILEDEEILAGRQRRRDEEKRLKDEVSRHRAAVEGWRSTLKDERTARILRGGGLL